MNRDNEKELFDISLAIAEQKKHQIIHNLPNFAPKSGICCHCKQNIYSQIDHGTFKTGISVEEASSSLITECPHCHKSYCD